VNFKKVFIISLIVLTFLLSYFMFLTGFLSASTIMQILIASGWTAPLLYVSFHLFRPFSFLPSSLLVLAAGLAFDFWTGLLLSIFAFMLGSSIVYMIGIKWKGFGAFKEHLEKAKKVTRVLKGKNKFFLASICLMPVLPADLVSYASGAAGMKYLDFFVGKLLGSFPGLFLVFLSGSQIKSEQWMYMGLSLAGFVLLTTIIWIKKKEIFGSLELEKI